MVMVYLTRCSVIKKKGEPILARARKPNGGGLYESTSSFEWGTQKG